jgi:hypothetical protein
LLPGDGSLEDTDSLIGHSGGCGDAIAAVEPQAQADGFLMVQFVSRGNVDRLHTITCSHSVAHDLPVPSNGLSGASSARRLPNVTSQETLRDSQGRLFIEDTDVAGEPEAPRVRQALAVADDQVGFALQLLQTLNENGDLTEGEKTRHIGKRRRTCGRGFLDDFSFGPSQENGRREEALPTAAVEGMSVRGRVETGHQKGPSREPTLRSHAPPQFQLKVTSLAGGQVPRMTKSWLHT